MSRDEPKVVVMVTLEHVEYREPQMFAARFRALGLTAYGMTREEARLRFFELFRQFVCDTREVGQLELQLRRSGVTWYTIEEYEQLGRRYIDVGEAQGQVPQADEPAAELRLRMPPPREAIAA